MPKCQNQGKPQYANELIKQTLKATLVTDPKKKKNGQCKQKEPLKQEVAVQWFSQLSLTCPGIVLKLS